MQTSGASSLLALPTLADPYAQPGGGQRPGLACWYAGAHLESPHSGA